MRPPDLNFPQRNGNQESMIHTFNKQPQVPPRDHRINMPQRLQSSRVDHKKGIDLSLSSKK